MVTFRVPDMTCGHCAGTIARAVAAVDKDAGIEVNIPHKLVRVVSTAPEAELAQAIQQSGYSPEKLVATPSVPASTGGGCCCGGAGSQTRGTPRTDTPGRSSCCGSSRAFAEKT